MATAGRLDLPPAATRSSRRRLLRGLALGVGAILLAGLLGWALVGRLHASRSGLTGALFTDMPPAPDFSLRDQNGNAVALNQFKGGVVAVTFLYTHCPDVCPLIASQLAIADQRLGPSAGKVTILAVSVDPLRDTLPAVKKFTADHDLAGDANWHYLIGSPGDLEPVWAAYHVDSSAISASDAAGVDHSALVYLIDKTGKLRVMLPPNFAVADFVQDVQALAQAQT